MKRSIVCIASLLALGLPVSTQALACQGTSMLFDDKFATIDPEWDNLAKNNGKIENNHLIISLANASSSNVSQNSINQHDIYRDVIVCVKFSFDATQRPAGTIFGIIFWGVNFNSFVSFDIKADGYYEISKYVGNRWLFPIPWTESALIKKELGQKQELEIHTKQNSVELFINGTKVTDFKGAMPSGGGTVGITYQLPGTGANISVTEFQVKN